MKQIENVLLFFSVVSFKGQMSVRVTSVNKCAVLYDYR